MLLCYDTILKMKLTFSSCTVNVHQVGALFQAKKKE